MKPETYCSLQPVLVAKINVKFGVYRDLLWYDVQSSFTVEADASQNYDMWYKLGSLNQKAILIHTSLFFPTA